MSVYAKKASDDFLIQQFSTFVSRGVGARFVIYLPHVLRVRLAVRWHVAAVYLCALTRVIAAVATPAAHS